MRFVGNRSSGRMGVALAEEAQPPRRRRDAARREPRRRRRPRASTVVETPTAADLEREALARADADVIVMAAAVADYRPAEPPRRSGAKDGAAWTVELEPTADVARRARRRQRRTGQVLVGFAADRGERGLERARRSSRKNADLFVFNDVCRADIGFDATDNEVVVVSRDGERVVEKAPKRGVAAAVLDEVERLLASR